MSTRTIGILATILGSALGAWWVTTQRRSRAASNLLPAREHGTVIYDNTPQASDAEAII